MKGKAYSFTKYRNATAIVILAAKVITFPHVIETESAFQRPESPEASPVFHHPVITLPVVDTITVKSSATHRILFFPCMSQTPLAVAEITLAMSKPRSAARSSACRVKAHDVLL